MHLCANLLVLALWYSETSLPGWVFWCPGGLQWKGSPNALEKGWRRAIPASRLGKASRPAWGARGTACLCLQLSVWTVSMVQWISQSLFHSLCLFASASCSPLPPSNSQRERIWLVQCCQHCAFGTKLSNPAISQISYSYIMGAPIVECGQGHRGRRSQYLRLVRNAASLRACGWRFFPQQRTVTWQVPTKSQSMALFSKGLKSKYVRLCALYSLLELFTLLSEHESSHRQYRLSLHLMRFRIFLVRKVTWRRDCILWNTPSGVWGNVL